METYFSVVFVVIISWDFANNSKVQCRFNDLTLCRKHQFSHKENIRLRARFWPWLW